MTLERCLNCREDIDEKKRFRCFFCREWFCLSCIVKHGFCKESGQLDGAIEFPGPSMMERVEMMQKRVEEMCSRAEAYFTISNKDIMPKYKWEEIGQDWVECKRHEERFASDTICTRCVEDIIAGSL